MGAHTAEGDDEGMQAVALALGVELSQDYGMVGRLTQSTRPPLDGGDGWAVHDKLLSGGVIGRGGLQSTEVGAVANLRLRVGADDLQVPGGHEEGVHLLWGSLVEQGGQEHPQVEVQRLGPASVHTGLVTVDLVGVGDAILPELNDHLGALLDRSIIPLATRQEVQVLVLEVWVADDQ